MRAVILLLFLFLTLGVTAGDPVRIALYYNSTLTRCTFTAVKGGYSFETDMGKNIEVKPGESVEISVASGALKLIVKGTPYSCRQVLVAKPNGFAEFKLLPAGSKPNGRVYEERVEFVYRNGRLYVINEIEAEKYVSGVIEAEGGGDHEPEYYKVQAVISRTYAYNNLRRHEAEGFHLCDATHCQVYHGKPRHEPLAAKATAATEDVVIVDQQINLITAAFHSNCGGHTVNSEHVWSKALPYCVGKPDPYCLVMPHSNWEKSVSFDQWQNYLRNKRFPYTDSTSSAFGFFPTGKQVYMTDSASRLPLRMIREDMKLKSTYFTIHRDGDQVKFIGQGFGHGVGLCQEGAMRMAQLGYNCREIIEFYYTDVHLVPRHLIWFFKEEP